MHICILSVQIFIIIFGNVAVGNLLFDFGIFDNTGFCMSFAEKFMTFVMPPRPRTVEDIDREIKELLRTLKRIRRSNIAREASNSVMRTEIIRMMELAISLGRADL